MEVNRYAFALLPSPIMLSLFVCDLIRAVRPVGQWQLLRLNGEGFSAFESKQVTDRFHVRPV